MNNEISDRVLSAWSSTLIPERVIKDGVWVVRCGEGSCILKRRHRDHATQRESRLLCLLKSHDIPVAVPIETIEGEYSVLAEGSSWTLFPYMIGQSVSLSDIRPEQARACGVVLSKLHLVFGFAPRFADLPVQEVAGIELPVGLIHRDFHPTNVLFNGNSISAVLDFDLICYGPRMFDIAYLGASLLAESFSSRRHFSATLTEIVRGYCVNSSLTAYEVAALPAALEFVEDVFIEWSHSVGNTTLEAAAREIKSWLISQRACTVAALERV